MGSIHFCWLWVPLAVIPEMTRLVELWGYGVITKYPFWGITGDPYPCEQCLGLLRIGVAVKESWVLKMVELHG